MVSSWINFSTLHEPRHDKPNKMSVRSAKTQISLGICPVWSESSLCAQWVAKDPSYLQADREDSDQTGQMPRLIWVFSGRKVTVTFVLLVLSCRGSHYLTNVNMATNFCLLPIEAYFAITVFCKPLSCPPDEYCSTELLLWFIFMKTSSWLNIAKVNCTSP